MFESKVKIVNKYGLHARPAMKFVETANLFQAAISVAKNGEIADGKSVMELMILEACCGSDLTIRAEGNDAEKAVETLSQLIENKFGFDDE